MKQKFLKSVQWNLDEKNPSVVQKYPGTDGQPDNGIVERNDGTGGHFRIQSGEYIVTTQDGINSKMTEEDMLAYLKEERTAPLYLVVAFTLKGQDFASQIYPVLKTLYTKAGVPEGFEDKPVILIHGFMPLAQVIDKGYSTEVVDALNEIFPVQISTYSNGSVNRQVLADLAVKMDAQVFIIGNIVEGVAEELDIYKKAGVQDITFLLAEAGTGGTGDGNKTKKTKVKDVVLEGEKPNTDNVNGILPEGNNGATPDVDKNQDNKADTDTGLV